jgi:hypothetical protein
MRVADLPPLVLQQRAFYELYEYSTSLPTATTLGKIWRRRVWGAVPHWVLGRYEPCPDPGYVKIGWYRPCVIPDGASLEQRGELWAGRFGRLTVCTPSWLWVWRALWREAGELAEEEVELLEPRLGPRAVAAGGTR